MTRATGVDSGRLPESACQPFFGGPKLQLLRQLTQREITARYRGSLLGMGWSLLVPLGMLAIYTLVFGAIFKVRWHAGSTEEPLRFALSLFAGLIMFNFFAEVATRAPTLITANPSYVKKVVFPLAFLPVVAVGAALFHATTNLMVLVGGLALLGQLSWWLLALPLVWAPLVGFVLGLAWFLAALGVYVRDVSQAVGPLTSALLFLSPVFYPMSAVPESLRPWLIVNPLTIPIEATRAIAFGAQAPDWLALGTYGVAAAAVSWIGWFWFIRTQKGFADVI